MGCSVSKVSKAEKRAPQVSEMPPLFSIQSLNQARQVVTDVNVLTPFNAFRRKISKIRSISPSSNQRLLNRSISLAMPRQRSMCKAGMDEVEDGQPQARVVVKPQGFDSFSRRCSQLVQKSYSLKNETTGKKASKVESNSDEKLERISESIKEPQKSHFIRNLLANSVDKASTKKYTRLSGLSQVDESTMSQNRINMFSPSQSGIGHQSPKSGHKGKLQICPVVQLFSVKERRYQNTKTEGPKKLPENKVVHRRGASPVGRVAVRSNAHTDSVSRSPPEKTSKFRISNSRKSSEIVIKDLTDSAFMIANRRESSGNGSQQVSVNSKLASNGCHIVKKGKKRLSSSKEKKLHDTTKTVKNDNNSNQGLDKKKRKVDQCGVIEPRPVIEDTSSASMIEEFTAPQTAILHRSPSHCSFEI